MSRTSAGAELSDALQAVGSATKDKAADTAKKVKTKTAKASDSISSAFDTAARRSWRTRRKTDRRSRVYARKRRRQLARAEQAKLRAKAAAASMAEAAAKLVSGDEEVPKKKRTSAKTFAFTLLAAGATLAVIQQLLGRRHADTTSTNGSGAEPGQSGPEQATATATEATDAATDQAAAATDAAMDQAAAATDGQKPRRRGESLRAFGCHRRRDQEGRGQGDFAAQTDCANHLQALPVDAQRAKRRQATPDKDRRRTSARLSSRYCAR